MSSQNCIDIAKDTFAKVLREGASLAAGTDSKEMTNEKGERKDTFGKSELIIGGQNQAATEVAKALALSAYKKGSTDNITVVVVTFHNRPGFEWEKDLFS